MSSQFSKSFNNLAPMGIRRPRNSGGDPTIYEPVPTLLWLKWQNITLASLIIASLVVLCLEYRHGIGLTCDSAQFISAANSLLHGQGLTTDVEAVRSRLTHFPPLYPLFLTLAHAITGNYLFAGTVLNFISLLCCYLLLWVFLDQNASRTAAVVAVFLLTCSAGIYQNHYLLGSDGVAIPFMLAGMCCLSKFGRATRPWILLLIGGAAFSAGSLTRYAYVAFIPAACLFLLVDGRVPLRKRIRSTVLLAAIACAPIMIVLWVNVLLSGSATNRVFAFHIVSVSKLQDAADYLSSWLLPYRVPLALRSLIIGALGILGLLLTIRSRVAYGLRITTAFMFGYLSFLLVSISFFDTATPLDERLLTPVIVILCAQVSLVCSWLWSWRPYVGTSIAAFLVLTPAFVGVTRLLPQVNSLYKDKHLGSSIAKLQADFQDVLPILRKLPENAVVYSNVPSYVYLVSGRHSSALPTVKGYTDDRVRTTGEIAAQVSELTSRIKISHGIVVYSLDSSGLFVTSLIDSSKLLQRIALKELFRSRSFVVFGPRASEPFHIVGARTPGQPAISSARFAAVYRDRVR